MKPPVPAIDVHTHLFPDRLMAAVRGALSGMYGWSFELPAEPEAFAAFVAEHGTERFCILPYAHKPGMARSLNAWVARTAGNLPGAIGFACVNQDDDADEVLTEAFDVHGLRGVKLHYQVQDVAPDDARLHALYGFMLERDLPLIVHAGKGPTDNGLVGAERFSAMMERFPELRVCVAHMGWPERDEFIAMLERYPKMYLDTSGIGNASFDPAAIVPVTDRILFGSDAPNIPYAYDLTVDRIFEMGLNEDTNEKIFRTNALKFLRL